MKKFIGTMKEKVVKALELPEEIMLDKVLVEALGSEKITIINHKGIMFYSEENIKITSKEALINIKGENLTLNTLLSEEIVIKGKIKSIEYIV